jgi:hypothetical protein
MILGSFDSPISDVALQQGVRHNESVSSTLIQTVELAQPQQVAPFF